MTTALIGFGCLMLALTLAAALLSRRARRLAYQSRLRAGEGGLDLSAATHAGGRPIPLPFRERPNPLIRRDASP